jgi:3-oxoacyl-[acyl-carrier protein] reductase
MNNLAGKIAIVTGASKGIGAGIAKALAAAGASVVVNYASSKDGAQRVVSEIHKRGGTAIAIQGDVAKSDDVKRLFEETKGYFGPPNVLVNNAGVFQFDPIESVTEETFHWHFNTNVLGPILTIQEALKYFPETGGSIINIGSVVSTNPKPSSALYSATKSALDVITVALSRELGPKNIRVNTVAPGHTETEGTVRMGLVGSDPSKRFAAETPIDARVGTPEDIAPAVVFLASEDAAWLTGERVSASGGWR